MAIKLERIDNYFIITNTVTLHEDRYPTADIYFRSETNTVAFMHKFNRSLIHSFLWVDLVDKDLASLTKLEAIDFLEKNTGGQQEIDAFLQDITNPLMVVNMSNVLTETTLSASNVVNDRVVDVVDATGFIVGQYLTIYNVASNRVFFSNILTISVNTITIDTPLDFAYPIGSFVTVGNINMNVDGSVTPQIFGVRNPGGQDVPLQFDITRVMFLCLTNTTVDLSKFGDIIGGLTRGIVMRRVDGDTRNILRAKTNGELKGIMFDFDIQVAQGNQQDGFTGRFTFAGQNRLGAVVRIGSDEDFQIIIQDDLTSLDFFHIVVEGHEVVD